MTVHHEHEWVSVRESEQAMMVVMTLLLQLIDDVQPLDQGCDGLGEE